VTRAGLWADWPKEYGRWRPERSRSACSQEEMKEVTMPHFPAGPSHLDARPRPLLEYGSEEQKSRSIFQIARGRNPLVSRGYSEPGAGSDLASLQLQGPETKGEPLPWLTAPKMDNHATNPTGFSAWCAPPNVKAGRHQLSSELIWKGEGGQHLPYRTENQWRIRVLAEPFSQCKVPKRRISLVAN